MDKKILLVGPYPPPHGGVSVHVASACSMMTRAGVQCAVLNVDPRAPENDAYIRISGPFGLFKELVRHAWNEWTFHVHTNGHNPRSWLVVLAGGIAGQFGDGCSVTLHSGLLPLYLSKAPQWQRTLATLACAMCERVICVNEEIARSVAEQGILTNKIEITPAFAPSPVVTVEVPEELEDWIEARSCLISSAMFFRPEYGFELLVQAMVRLQRLYPEIGCVVMGGGEGRAAAEAVLRAEGLDETVRLAGDVDHEVCLAMISRSAVFVRPTYRDGDSISVREALSMGVPVVASNVGTRPPGAVLFEAGDVDGLVAALKRVMDQETVAALVTTPALRARVVIQEHST